MHHSTSAARSLSPLPASTAPPSPLLDLLKKALLPFHDARRPAPVLSWTPGYRYKRACVRAKSQIWQREEKKLKLVRAVQVPAVMKDVVVAAGGGRAHPASSTPPCAACKLLRRRCAAGCVFAPYFPSSEPHRFASVHKVFGASNLNKLLQVTWPVRVTVVCSTIVPPLTPLWFHTCVHALPASPLVDQRWIPLFACGFLCSSMSSPYDFSSL